MLITNEVQIRRRDVANYLLRKGFKIVRVCKDYSYKGGSNFVFEYSLEIVDTVKEALNELHIKEDDPRALREIPPKQEVQEGQGAQDVPECQNGHRAQEMQDRQENGDRMKSAFYEGGYYPRGGYEDVKLSGQFV